MSVVCETDFGWYVNHETAVSEIYRRCEVDDNGHLKSYGLKSAMFDIQCPFMMDTQFENWKLKQQPDVYTKTRKRKKKKQEEDSDVSSVELHKRLMSAYQVLVAIARTHGHLQERQELPDNNNTEARAAANIMGPGDKLEEFAEMWSKGGNSWYSPIDIIGTEVLKMSDLYHRRVSYWGDNSCVFQLEGGQYLIPPNASFVMSDFDKLLSNTESLYISGGYDLIVVDPPWQNKSVKRKKSYSCLEEENLLHLPTTHLAADGCVVVVWVTNKPRLLDFVKDQILPAWGVQHVCQWHWIKVTVTGALICDINSSTKKPYETLMLGRVKKTKKDHTPVQDNITAGRVAGGENSDISKAGGDCFTISTEVGTSGGDNSNISSGISSALLPTELSTPGGDNLEISSDISTGGADNSDIPKTVSISEVDNSSICAEVTRGNNCDLPDNRVLLSVPCSLHSKKPPIQNVLQKWLRSEPRCLELFARNLWPGWVSWGHEALKHQHLDYYEEKT